MVRVTLSEVAPPVAAAIPADWDPFADLQPPAVQAAHPQPLPAFDLPAQPGDPLDARTGAPLEFELPASVLEASAPSGSAAPHLPFAASPLGSAPLGAVAPDSSPLGDTSLGDTSPDTGAAPERPAGALPQSDPFAALGLAKAGTAQPPAQPEPPLMPARPVVESPREAPRSPAAATGSGSAAEPELLQAFLRGAGLERLQIQPADRVAQMEAIGRSYRLMVEGLVDVLRARASLKGEFRMSQTMIRPVENNPLKFAPNVEEALLLLLRQGNQAFMPPDQAVSESFEDLKAHQIAVMAGIQAALRHLLARFEPRALEGRLDKPGGLAALLPGARQAKYWELFTQLYASISREAEEDFQDLFGREFSRAYEEQIARLQRS